MKELFGGLKRRDRISLGREWDWTIVTITAGQSLSDEIDMRFCAGAAVFIDPTTLNTHLIVYTSHEPAGGYIPAQDKNGTLLIVPATVGRAVTLPAEIFPLGYIRLGACNSAGTLLAVATTRRYVVVMKP